MNEQTPPVKLLLSSKKAAQSLSIGERLLWAWTHPRGPIPCVRISSRVLYDPADLARFIESRKNGGTK